jgi:hypothetical protein
MSGWRLRAAYQVNSPTFGAAGVVLLTATTNPTVYQCKASDYLVLVDLSGYGGAGPTVTLPQAPFEDFAVTVRNIAGSGATHNWQIAAPASLAGGFEDPTTQGNFIAALNVTTTNFEATWVLDRARNRYVLLDPDAAAAGPLAPINFSTTDSTPHTATSVVLPAAPSVTLVEVKWVARDTTSVVSGGAGESQGVFANTAGTASQISTTTVVSAKGAGSVSFTVSTNQVNVQVTGDGNATNWTLYVSTFPSTT